MFAVKGQSRQNTIPWWTSCVLRHSHPHHCHRDVILLQWFLYKETIICMCTNILFSICTDIFLSSGTSLNSSKIQLPYIYQVDIYVCLFWVVFFCLSKTHIFLHHMTADIKKWNKSYVTNSRFIQGYFFRQTGPKAANLDMVLHLLWVGNSLWLHSNHSLKRRFHGCKQQRWTDTVQTTVHCQVTLFAWFDYVAWSEGEELS